MRHEITLEGYTWYIDILQDSDTGEFQIELGPDVQGNAPNTHGDSRYIEIDATELTDPDYSPANNIETRTINAHQVDGKTRVDLTMSKDSLFEAWAIPLVVRTGFRGVTIPSLWLIFDLFRYQLILNNQPLIEFHGFLVNNRTVAANDSIIAPVSYTHLTLPTICSV